MNGKASAISKSRCSIAMLEPVLDAYARGAMPEAMSHAHLQAHLSSCEYCGSLLRAAEEIRGSVVQPLRAAASA